ncbi:MAG: SMI1/KNR4 family protein [Isosphaerales bacterium]
MDIEAALRGGLDGWQVRRRPASSDALASLAALAPKGLPSDYLDLLAFGNGGEGNLGVQPGWFQLWRAEDVVESNKGYQVEVFLPGFFGFGSNGGVELLAFDTRDGVPWAIVMVPFIPMEADHAVVISKDFADFIRALGHVCPDA